MFPNQQLPNSTDGSLVCFHFKWVSWAKARLTLLSLLKLSQPIILNRYRIRRRTKTERE